MRSLIPAQGTFIRKYLILLSIVVLFNFCTKPMAIRDSRPNIVVIVADDLGYSDLGCFGSEIKTPNIDALAEQGQIFTNFYTAATCSPTRAMLLTGVDHHLAGLGDMAERMVSIPEEVDQPGYEGYLNDRVVSCAQLIKDVGYHTYLAGKWHLGLTPDQSPGSKGFERSFALMQGYANHFLPDPGQALFWENNNYVNYPNGRFSTDLYTDKMLNFLRKDKNDGCPFLLYAAYTAPHWPLQAPDDFIDKYHGVYEMGYDSLRQSRFNGLKNRGIINDSLKLPEVPAFKGALYYITDEPLLPWKALSESEKSTESRKMEIYAAMIENLDFNIGRLISYLKEIGKYDNTFFFFLSDNGAAAAEALEVPDPGRPLEYMGTTNSFVAYGPQWAHASSAVNRLYKGYSSEGGIHTPLIIKMPRQQTGKEMSADFCTILDLAPTLIELSGSGYPETYAGHKLAKQIGSSMLPYLEGRSTKIHDDDYVMGWELFGRSAIRKGKWKICQIEEPFGSGTFQLFNLEDDPSESNDLSDLYPALLKEMLDHWEKYIRENGVVLTE